MHSTAPIFNLQQLLQNRLVCPAVASLTVHCSCGQVQSHSSLVVCLSCANSRAHTCLRVPASPPSLTGFPNLQEASGKVMPSMYCDGAGQLPLERCMRVLPHHNDSGGFFIAVLRKLADIPEQAPTYAFSQCSWCKLVLMNEHIDHIWLASGAPY